MTRTKVALLGAGFIADIHIESYHRFVPEAKVESGSGVELERALVARRKNPERTPRGR